MRGLVLQGGGSRGAFQMGAWRAFNELGIKFDVITGTSIGSLNGALMAQDEYDKCYELWYDIAPQTFMTDDAKTYSDLVRVSPDIKDIGRYAQTLVNVIRRGGVDIDPLIKLIDEVVDEKKIREKGVKFGLVTVSVSEMKPKEIFIDDEHIPSSVAPISFITHYIGDSIGPDAVIFDIVRNICRVNIVFLISIKIFCICDELLIDFTVFS